MAKRKSVSGRAPNGSRASALAVRSVRPKKGGTTAADRSRKPSPWALSKGPDKLHVLPPLSAGNRAGMSKIVARALDAHADRLHDLEQKVADLLSRLPALPKEEQGSAPSLAKGKEWIPKVGDYVVVCRAGYTSAAYPVIKIEPNSGLTYYWLGEKMIGGRWLLESIRPAIPAEIEAYEVSQEKGVLVEGDACEVTLGQHAEILDLLNGCTQLMRFMGEPECGGLRYDAGKVTDTNFVQWIGGPLNKIPFPLFKKKLQNTISAKKTEEEQREKLEAEKERNRVPEIGDRVEFADGGGPGFGHIATNGTDDALNYGIVVDRTGGSFDFILRTRNEFTILTP